MYDAQTRSRWSQLVGEAVDGSKKGSKLTKLPSTMTTWKNWRTLHPDTTVYVKRSIPYHARFTGETFAGIARSEAGPIRANDLVVGLEGHVTAKAYLVRQLAKTRLLHDSLEGAPILVYLSRDLATVRVLDRRIEGRELSFSLTDSDLLRDKETGTTWDPLTGLAAAGPLRGKRLSDLVATHSLWFAWKKYRPDTVLIAE